MNVPVDSIECGPYTFAVEASEDAIRRVRAEHGPTVLGITCLHEGRIVVSLEGGPSVARVTLLHEVEHVVNDVCGIGTQRLSEEEWIHRTTPTLLDTLRRNPHMVWWLMEGASGWPPARESAPSSPQHVSPTTEATETGPADALARSPEAVTDGRLFEPGQIVVWEEGHEPAEAPGRPAVGIVLYTSEGCVEVDLIGTGGRRDHRFLVVPELLRAVES